jgi:sigma-B regulation protein RsbU (phosphoserine phosphatase)
VTDGTATRPDLPLLADALDALRDGVLVFDLDWTIVFVNRVGADLMDRRPEDLVDRNLRVALPLLGGTIFHSFLLHAMSAGQRVTWQGFHAPTSRWLSASAVRAGDRLHVQFHEVAEREAPAASAGAESGAARPDETADRSRDRLRFLAEVSEAMISTLDTGESAATLAELVVRRLCDWAIVSVLGEDGAPTDVGRAHADPARQADLATYLDGRARGGGDESPLVAALHSGRPVQMTTIDEDLVETSLTTEDVRAAWQRLDTASCTIVPLRARGETFGALALMNTSRRPPHTEMEIATAVEAARRASLALDNARLYGRQLKVAETFQQSLLSPPPQPDRLEIAVRYLPAATNMHVGGDWYDGFQQPDGATLLVIGDVVGHNVEAAAAMGQIRSTVRTVAYDRQESPAQILDRADAVLTGLRMGTLATVLLARIEQTPEQVEWGWRTLRWSSAGHLPPLILRSDGAVEVLASAPEMLLGTGSPHARTDHQAVFQPGDTLIFYTDGLVEHGRTGIDEGITRLAQVVRELTDLTMDPFCDQLLDRIISHHTDDDVAIIAVRCHPTDESR